MTMKISRKGNVVFLEGLIDENADFSPLLSESAPLCIDLSGISRINSIGVRSWMKFITQWGDKPMEYHECPAIISDQLVVTPVLLGVKKRSVNVKSAHISFSCSKCGRQEDRRILSSQVLPVVLQDAIEPPCVTCKSKLTMINPDQLEIFKKTNP